jgi:predicted O-methyltransferase YrrM
MKLWIDTFQSDYAKLLDRGASGATRGLIEGLYKRAEGFQIIFEALLKQKSNNFAIIETGTVRKPNNWKDGNSGFLFSEMVRLHGGFVRSVDIDQTAVDTANEFIDQQYYKSYCSDSVTWLASLEDLNSVDLFYLDSYDVTWADDTPSAAHHLKEFQAIETYLKPGCIVAIDDNSRLLENNQRTGKGRMIVEYLESKGIHPIYDAYQIIYKF